MWLQIFYHIYHTLQGRLSKGGRRGNCPPIMFLEGHYPPKIICIFGSKTSLFSKGSVEQYYNTGFIINYQLQIPLHFDSTVKTESCEYYFNLLTHGVPFVYRNHQTSTILTYWIFDEQLGLSWCQSLFVHTAAASYWPNTFLHKMF